MENYIQILNNLASYNSSQIESYNAQINNIYTAIDQFKQQMTDFNTFISHLLLELVYCCVNVIDLCIITFDL